MAHFIRLSDFQCPAPTCKGKPKSYDWVCAQDKSYMMIAQTGVMRCSNYDERRGAFIHSAPICEWRFDCGNHGNHPADRYQYADFDGFLFALSYAVQMTSTAGAQWVGQLCHSLGQQYGN